MKKGVFRRIFILYAVIMFLSLLLIEFYITETVRENHLENLEKDLSVRIDLLSESLPFNQKNIDEFCRSLKKKTGARITVIQADGRVVGDSDHDSSAMDNHAGRPEIAQALYSGTGAAIRYSDTIKQDFLYVARTVTAGTGTVRIVRMAVPLKDADSSINMLRLKIIVVVSIVLLISGIFSVWQTEHLRRLLRQIMDFSRSLAHGEISRRLFLRNAGEFDEIAKNITEMSVELQSIMARNEEEKERLNVILKSIPDALLIIDSRGIIRLSNPASGEFFGDMPITGSHFIEVVRNDNFSGLVDSVRRNRAPGTAEFGLDYPSEKHLAVRVSPLSYREDELSGFVAVFHDITQLKKLEQVRKDFVANVSHEIKTPVTAIRGFADTLLEGALDDKEHAVKFLQTIKANSERINSLVDDLMTISKIELGVIRVEKAVIDLEDVAENILAVLGDKAADRDLYLKTVVAPELREISADRNRLIQILTNLVDNAIKFTETGGVTFGIGREHDRPYLFVEDTGIGIPEKHLPRIGERFYRVDPARSRKLGGTGLGLAIVKHLVKAHGWEMKIDSVPGKGTKVKINL